MEVNVKIQTKVAEHRQAISTVASMVGKQFFTVESRSIWEGAETGFEKDKAAIAADGNKKFILNRSPRKYLIKDHNILGACLGTDPVTEEVVLNINPQPDGTAELSIPVSDDMVKEGIVTPDAIKAALNGEKPNSFFLNANKIVPFINKANLFEVSNLETLRATIDKMIQNLKTAVAQNQKKAEEAESQWANSALKPDMASAFASNGQVVIQTHVATEE